MDKDKIAVLGHSLGALIAVLFQAEQPRAKTLILPAPAVQQRELISQWYAAGERRFWKKQGYLNTKKGRIEVQYLNEAEALDWKKAVSDIKVPVLIIYGAEDEDVPCEYTMELYRQLVCPKSIAKIKGADHHFEGQQAKEELIDVSLKWLKNYL
jgi:alpha-beta hydrolase superfamily lysophospholipase